MTKCLFKALKAVDLEKHVGLFRSLGYESAGALAHFRAEHFEKLNFTEQELLRLIALLDVLKESTREGKICPHYFNSSKTTTQQSTIKSKPIYASWSDETVQQRNTRKQSNDNLKPKRSTSSIGVTQRSSSATMVRTKLISNESNFERPSTVLSRQHSSPTKTNTQRYSAPKSFLNRPAVQHVKVKSYNYGVPTTNRQRNIFLSSPRRTNDMISYAKPAEIYVYARKRPLLSTETNFQDAIAVPDNKRVIIAENKANLDCTPLLKKTEFQFDHVFGSDVTNKHIFDSTVLPLILPTQRHNLTYICFGQTGSGKSHTIFGSKNTDGLLVHCTQLLLKEINIDNNLICSFYEIYNNQVYDLVNVGKRLFVREDGEHHVNVIGVTEVALRNLDNLRCVIDNGLSRRHHGKSAFNSNSSRSHAIFQITLKNLSKSSENFRLIFIDLAGSERATDAQNNLRQTRREGAQINCSLLALKECIRSMDLTHSHAPFRQSKLTHILRDSLVGTKTRTCLMANVSPADDCCQCSLNTLQYASRIRDISIRHRHRTVPMTNLSINYNDDIKIEQDKTQKNFKPSTVSTPVHRFMPSVNQHMYDIETRLTKPIDIDWQIANDDDDDDDIPITGGGDNLPLKSLTLSTREFQINANQIQSDIHRFQQKLTADMDESLSSYFPQPQTDIKKSSSNEIKRSFNSSRLMYDDGNERQWKSVPAPTTTTTTTTTATTTRYIPVAPIHISDDNPYSSATGTESLGTKITKAASNGQRQQKSHIENFEPFDTYRDQTGFYTNRDELLSIVSNRLTNGTQRSSSVTTPKNSRNNSRTGFINSSKSSVSTPNKTTRPKNRSIKSSSSATSLASVKQDKKSLIETKKPKVTSAMNFHKFDPSIRRSTTRHQQQQQQQRSAPLRVHHHYSSDSEEYEKSRHNIQRRKRNDSSQTIKNTNTSIMKNEKQPKDDYFLQEQKTNNKNIEQSASLSVPNSTPLPLTSPPPSFDHTKSLYNRSFQQQPMSPLPSANINNPWTLSSSYGSPSKEFGVRVSDQLNALRSLLETRLLEQDDNKRQTKESSILQTSPGTFARDFLHSLRQSSSFKNNSTEFHSDIDDADKEVARNFHTNKINHEKYEGDILSTSTISSNHRHHHYEQILQPNLSSLSDELNQARVSSSVTASSSSTITSNLAAKIDTQEPRILLSQIDDIHSPQSPKKNPITTNDNQGINGQTSDSERTSQVNSTSQNPFTGTSSGGSSSNASRSRSPVLLPPFSTFDFTSSTTNDQNHLFDNGNGNSLLTGSTFDALLNSLKSMREKDLDFVVRTGDDKLIPVAD